LVPSSNTTVEPEFYAMLPKRISVHTARIRLQKVTIEALSEMESGIEAEAAKLADAAVDTIGFACTTGSLFRGLGHDKTIEKIVECASGKPAVTTASAVVDALKTLNMENVAVATPYIDEMNRLERGFLRSSGFSVLDLEGLGLSDNSEIGKVDSQSVFDLVVSLKHQNADGIFISCTNLHTMEIIGELEEELQKPVISSNTATLWAMLRKCHIEAKISGHGKILERCAHPDSRSGC
jgi:maleate isomerase